MKHKRHVLANADITEIVLAPPRGHQHLRATSKLHSGEEIILQEATVANLVRSIRQGEGLWKKVWRVQ